MISSRCTKLFFATNTFNMLKLGPNLTIHIYRYRATVLLYRISELRTARTAQSLRWENGVDHLATSHGKD